MKSGILREITYFNIAQNTYEVYITTPKKEELNFYVNKVNGASPTKENLEILKGNHISFEICNKEFTDLIKSINIIL